MGQLALIQMPRCRKRSSWYSILLSAPEVPWRPFATFSNKVCYSHAGYASGRTKVTSCGRHHSTAYSAGAAQSTIRGSLRVWPYTHAPHARRQHEAHQDGQGRLAVRHARHAPPLYRLGAL